MMLVKTEEYTHLNPFLISATPLTSVAYRMMGEVTAFGGLNFLDMGCPVREVDRN